MSDKKANGNRRYMLPMKKNCTQCGGEFEVTTRYQAARNKFCSKECRKEANTYFKRGNTPNKEREGMILLNCAVCGGEFWRPKSHAERAKNPTCSKSCNGKLRIHATFNAPKVMTEKRKKELSKIMKGSNNPSWKGGVTYSRSKGNYKGARYVKCPEEFAEMARKDGYVMEHRLVIAKAICRPLKRTEVVHHINHDSLDNRLENLELWVNNSAHKLHEHGKTDLSKRLYP